MVKLRVCSVNAASGLACVRLVSLLALQSGILTLCAQSPVIYSFTGGSDGAYPDTPLIADQAGNLYGATAEGGPDDLYGSIYELPVTGGKTVLYGFTGGADGASPQGPLLRDSAGNLYGTTDRGGAPSSTCPVYGCGVVFKLDMTGKETILHTFTNTDGLYPKGLIQDLAGNLYGAGTSGGASNVGV